VEGTVVQKYILACGIRIADLVLAKPKLNIKKVNNFLIIW
jgi:hypothetical protein